MEYEAPVFQTKSRTLQDQESKTNDIVVSNIRRQGKTEREPVNGGFNTGTFWNYQSCVAAIKCPGNKSGASGEKRNGAEN